MSKYSNAPKEMNEIIRYLRTKNGYTQREVADAIDVGTSIYSLYESGKRSISIDVITKIADFYSVSIPFVMGIDSNKTVKNAEHMLSFFSDRSKKNIKKMENNENKDALTMLDALLSDDNCIPLLESLKRVCDFPELSDAYSFNIPIEYLNLAFKEYLKELLGIDMVDTYISDNLINKFIGTFNYSSDNYLQVIQSLIKASFSSNLDKFISSIRKKENAERILSNKIDQIFHEKMR